MTKLEYTFKTDTLFKLLFVKYPDLLKQLVSELLEIPLNDIEQFEIKNQEMPPEVMGDKFCRLDINMMVNGQLVDLELQVRNEGDYPERILYYWAREYSSSLPTSGNYIYLPRTVVISIINFNQLDCKEFHSEFRPLEVTRHELLTDKMSLHFFELPKLPNEISPNNMLLLWLSLFKADTLEELEKIKAMEVPVMEKAINAYHSVTVSPEFRNLEKMRADARYNEAAALRNAEQKAEQKAEKRFIDKLKNGKSPEEIIKEYDAKYAKQ
jgi:predicted transposase/invertase (TIGR01784 family)